MRDKDLVALLKREGWVLVRISGSHYVFQKNGKTVVVPVHGKDLPTGLLHAILKETGLK